jgi:hypothetical protein
MRLKKFHQAGLLLLLTITCAPLSQLGCSSNDSPPFYTARITTVYNEQNTVEHFSLHYWWEERGETPFLKPYNLASKELIVELMTPIKDDTSRVTVTTERFSFEAIKMIDIELTDTGKQIIISTKDGRRITATTNFPKILKNDAEAGFADNKIFVQGKINESGMYVDYKLEFNYIKKITIINKTDR